MARPVNYSAVLFLFSILLFMYPVAAEGAGSSIADTQTANTPVPYTITLFIPTADMIHSDQIKDQIIGLNGYDAIFATSFGLSTYNGSWSTRHANLNNISAGILDDYITAIEYDAKGNLWLGYSGGIQIYNGRDYQVIQDQQLLKDPRINDIQRWNNDVWVATGNAGIHRYRDGTWTWFQPMTPSGPGFYEIDSMVLDPAADAMLIATANQGLWVIRSPDDPVRFELLAGKNTSFAQLKHVRRDPQGGGYFFDDTSVVHYGKDSGFVQILTTKDLSPYEIAINDIAAGPDGKLYIASDNGLFIWENGKIYRHLNRFEGIGSSQIVRTVNIDAQNRVWFSTPGYVGFYFDQSNPETIIGINLVTPTPDQTYNPAGVQTTIPSSGYGAIPGTQSMEGSKTGTTKNGILDPVFGLINSITGLAGIRIFP
nr:two-component regulator propeller domain-containing protein [uncultured Methanoregula sp.]